MYIFKKTKNKFCGLAFTIGIQFYKLGAFPTMGFTWKGQEGKNRGERAFQGVPWSDELKGLWTLTCEVEGVPTAVRGWGRGSRDKNAVWRDASWRGTKCFHTERVEPGAATGSLNEPVRMKAKLACQIQFYSSGPSIILGGSDYSLPSFGIMFENPFLLPYLNICGYVFRKKCKYTNVYEAQTAIDSSQNKRKREELRLFSSFATKK